jgi:transposase
LTNSGLQVAGQRLEPGRAVLACRVVETDEFARWCRRCGCEAAPRDSVTRRLAHEPLGWRPTTLLITIRRYRCTGCGHVSRQDTSRAAEPRAKLSRRTLHTGAALLTEKQQARLEALFAVSEHVEVEATWGIYQRMIAAYREPGKKHGKAMMQAVIDSVASGVPATLAEIRKLGRTLKQRATDILAFFDRPGTRTAPPRPSTAGSNTSAVVAPSDSGT